MRLVQLLILLLLAAAWLLALLGAWASLMAGLAPTLGLILATGWTLLTSLVYRLARPRGGRLGWQLALPALWLLLSYSCFAYGITWLRERQVEQPGFPRRYYAWPNQ